MSALALLLLAADPYASLRELPKQLPLDALVSKVSPVMSESPDGTDRVELLAPKKLVVYIGHPRDPAQLCPIKAGQHVRIIASDTDLPEIVTRLELRVVESGRICKGRTMLTLSVMGANPTERTRAGVTSEPGAQVLEKEIETQRVSVALGPDERPMSISPYRFDTSDKFYVAPTFASCVFKLGDVLDVPPLQWAMCSSNNRCWATDSKTGTPCTLWTDVVQTADTLPSNEPPAVRSAR